MGGRPRHRRHRPRSTCTSTASGAAVTVANIQRPDIGRRYPSSATTAASDVTIPVTQAPHRVCVYAISVGNGGNRQLGCANVTGNTVGTSRQRDPQTGQPRAARLGNRPGHHRVGARSTSTWTESARRSAPPTSPAPTSESVMPEYGSAHGFVMNVPVVGRPHRVRVRDQHPWQAEHHARVRPHQRCPARLARRRDPAERHAAGPGLGVRPGHCAARSTCTSTSTGSVAAVGAANTIRPDVGSIFGGWGDRHGFDFAVRRCRRGTPPGLRLRHQRRAERERAARLQGHRLSRGRAIGASRTSTATRQGRA